MSGPTIQQSAVKRYGKSFPRIVHDLAHAGYSRSEAAKVLGYKCHKSLISICDRHGWSEWFLPRKLTKGADRSKAAIIKMNKGL
jgi:hypothetical protein